MRAILIDPVAKTVTEVAVENTLEAFYRLLRCGLIEAVHPRGLLWYDHLYVDEEGLFKEGQAFFMIKGCGQPLAGRALVVGDDGEGNTVDVVTARATVEERVAWQT